MIPGVRRSLGDVQGSPGRLQLRTAGYDVLLADVAHVIEEARRAAARSVNAVMTATYWLIGRRIVEQEQEGQARAGDVEELVGRLYAGLTARVWPRVTRQRLRHNRHPDRLYL